MRQSRRRQCTDVTALLLLRRGIWMAANCFILVVPIVERGQEILVSGIGGNPAVELVKRGLPQQYDQFTLRQLHRAAKGVGIQHPTTRQVETLVDPVEQIPHLAAQKQRIRLRNRLEPTIDGGFVGSADLEEAIAVPRPIDRIRARHPRAADYSPLRSPIAAGRSRDTSRGRQSPPVHTSGHRGGQNAGAPAWLCAPRRSTHPQYCRVPRSNLG